MGNLKKPPNHRVKTSNSQQLGLGRAAGDALSAKSDMICEALPESLIHGTAQPSD
jgi:hypothetical protein